MAFRLSFFDLSTFMIYLYFYYYLETRNLTKDSKRKFLDGLLKILRNLRSRKKIELSPTRTPKRIAVPQFSVDQQQPLIINRNTISANLSRHHIYNDDKKPEERSNVSNPANVSTNINQSKLTCLMSYQFCGT